jgi:murein DD-endopeptidase MepM/ murein hydrolase activator NlpD
MRHHALQHGLAQFFKRKRVRVAHDERRLPGQGALQQLVLPLGQARNYLATFLFRGDDVFRPISTLSGGERGRMALAKLALSGANLLLLDEPTNHLDIPSQEILQGVLETFEGTILLASENGRVYITGPSPTSPPDQCGGSEAANWGNRVVINHADSATLYLHLREVWVTSGPIAQGRRPSRPSRGR